MQDDTRELPAGAGSGPARSAKARAVPSFERHYMLLPQLNLAYARVPKAANSSIRFLLATRFGLEPPDPGLRPNKDRFWTDQPPDKARSLTVEEFAALQSGRDRPWCFSVVRNPVSRLYSAWNNKVIENADLDLSGKFREMGVTAGMDFADFVDCVVASPDDKCDIHVRSQMAILSDGEGRILPDFIGRVETINPDWNHIRYEIRVRCARRIKPLPRKNVRAEVQPNVADTLPAPVLRKIIDRYREDFERFYPRELNTYKK